MPQPGQEPGRTEGSSLADAEIAEDGVQHVLDIDSAGEPAERPGRQAQVLGRQFRCPAVPFIVIAAFIVGAPLIGRGRG